MPRARPCGDAEPAEPARQPGAHRRDRGRDDQPRSDAARAEQDAAEASGPAAQADGERDDLRSGGADAEGGGAFGPPVLGEREHRLDQLLESERRRDLADEVGGRVADVLEPVRRTGEDQHRSPDFATIVFLPTRNAARRRGSRRAPPARVRGWRRWPSARRTPSDTSGCAATSSRADVLEAAVERSSAEAPARTLGDHGVRRRLRACSGPGVAPDRGGRRAAEIARALRARRLGAHGELPEARRRYETAARRLRRSTIPSGRRRCSGTSRSSTRRPGSPPAPGRLPRPRSRCTSGAATWTGR